MRRSSEIQWNLCETSPCSFAGARNRTLNSIESLAEASGLGVEIGEVGVKAFFCTWRIVCVAFSCHSYLSRLHHQQQCSVGAVVGRTKNVGHPPGLQRLCVRFLFLSQSHRAVRLILFSRPLANQSVHARHKPWRPAPQARPQCSSRR